MGMFGFAEIMRNLDAAAKRATWCADAITGLLPTQDDLKQSMPAVLRGTCSARCSAFCRAAARCSASFAAYTLEKKVAEDPAAFGTRRDRGRRRAGDRPTMPARRPSFIPLLTLGIPPNAVMALMVGAMTIHGIMPGPAGHDQAARTCSGA